MSKEKFVKDYLEEAKFRLDMAKIAFDKNRYNTVFREAQIIVEMSTKALFRRWGFAIPKTHNLSQHLEDSKELFSKDIQENFEFMIVFSKKLRREYEVSLYGNEEEGISLSELYSKEQTKLILINTKKFYDLCYNELKDFIGG